jgi:mycothiol synthase
VTAAPPHGLEWRPLRPGDLEAVRALAMACLEADGGLPLLAETGMLTALYGDADGIVATDATGPVAAGEILAVAAVRAGADAATGTGMVHPRWRHRGVGTHLLHWLVDHAGDRPLVVRTETCAPEAERLYNAHGLRQVFAELVLAHDLRPPPVVALPAAYELVPVAEASLDDLFGVYTRSFADRPGFTRPAQEEWLEDLLDDPTWDPHLSALVHHRGAAAGFVNVVGSWVDQVGVVPEHRGRGLGAALLGRALTGFGERGAEAAWLTVEVANPALALYRSLGFTLQGKRARFA